MLYFNPLDYFFIILNDYVLLYIIISKNKSFIIIFLKCTCVIYEVLSDWLIHYVLFTSYKLVSKVVSFWFTFHSQNMTFFPIFWDQSKMGLIHILVVTRILNENDKHRQSKYKLSDGLWVRSNILSSRYICQIFVTQWVV